MQEKVRYLSGRSNLIAKYKTMPLGCLRSKRYFSKRLQLLVSKCKKEHETKA